MKVLITLVVLACLFTLPIAAQTTTGTWSLYPSQSQTYQVTVQPPINPDGTSVWPAKKGVIPVQFSLSRSFGPVVFQSIGSSISTTDDYSYLSFHPMPSVTFDKITNLTAVYSFVTGNCHGGSLRWEIGLDNGTALFIYYGAEPNTTDCTTPGSSTNQSGVNMIGLSDLRYDTSQIGGNFYDTYANAVTLTGTHALSYVALILDSGWGADQVVTLGNVTVNDNTFQPQTGSTPTCDLPPAMIQVTALPTTPAGSIDEVISVQPNDNNLMFRTADCKYLYNLAVKDLFGVGSYKVEAVIGGNAASGYGKFALQ